jgi:hypothetical protein
MDGETATILRPSLQGAIIAKSYAFAVWQDDHRNRHLIDLVVLATLIGRSDRVGEGLAPKERDRILLTLSAAKKYPPALLVAGAAEGIERLETALG